MSGRVTIASLRVLAMMALALLGSTLSPVNAQEGGSLWADPLRVEPRILREGARLPGDRDTPNCARAYDTSQPLDLALAADLALCNSPKLRATWEAIKVQAGVLGEARAASLPTVTASVTLQRERNVYPGDPALESSRTGHSSFVGATWRLFDFGGRAANRQSADHLLQAALASHDAKLQELLDSLIAAYFDAMKARAELDASSATGAAAQRTLEATQRREAKGTASHSDTLQAQVALAKAELAHKRNEGSYNKAIALLGYAIGLPIYTEIQLPAFETPAPEVVGELDQWLGLAEQQHPALKAARQQWEAMTRKVSVTRSEGRPTVDLTANLFDNGYPNQGIDATSTRQITYGITLTVPLFEGFARTYKVQEASAQADAAAAQFQDTEYQILMNVVRAHADAVSALGNLDSSATLLSASQAAQESSERRYAGGAASILEVMTSQSNLAEAEQQRAQCLSEWYAARLRLMASAGTLGRTRLEHPAGNR